MASSAAPRWQQRAAWLGLVAALLIAISGVLFVGSGRTDPPRAGSVQWQTTSLPIWILAPGAEHSQWLSEKLPVPPFSLEITVQFDPDSDPLAYFAISLTPDKSDTSDRLPLPQRISVQCVGSYQLSADPRWVDFPHLMPAGGSNRVTVDIDDTGAETLRFNGEIAWQGTYSYKGQSVYVMISGDGGADRSSQIIWKSAVLYSP